MGHALTHAADIMVRFAHARQNVWVPGMDHAYRNPDGCGAQTCGRRSPLTTREQFIDKVWSEGESGGMIFNQLSGWVRRDWSRERFTMDEGLRAVLEVVMPIARA